MILQLAYRILRHLRNITFQILGIKTIGVRALVLNKDQVLLIKHTYQKGWYAIGGMVEKNESPHQAIHRELLEEVGLVPLEEPKLFSVYHSTREKRDDYILFYIVQKFDMKDSYSPEIAEKKWFSLDALPDDISPATARRIEEFLGGKEKSARW